MAPLQICSYTNFAESMDQVELTISENIFNKVKMKQDIVGLLIVVGKHLPC